MSNLPRVLVDPLLRRVVRRVRGAGAVVEEERLVGRDRLGVLDELDRLVGEVDREVVALLGRLRLRHRMVVVDEVRIPLVRLAAEEAVVALEPAPERPLALRRGEVHLVLGAEVPLAHVVRVPAALAEDLGDVRALERDVAVRVREAGRRLGDARHPVRRVVAPGQQARPGRRAQRRRVEGSCTSGHARRCAGCSASRSGRRRAPSPRTRRRRARRRGRSGAPSGADRLGVRRPVRQWSP